MKYQPVLFIGLLLSYPMVANATVIEGHAAIVDGDGLKITVESGEDPMRVRLVGIDAPELGQTCLSAALEQFDCGRRSRTNLVRVIDGHEVRCIGKRRDRYRRLLAKCWVRDIDLGEHQVSTGFARAYVKYSLDYFEAEKAAKQQKKGLWNGFWDEPWKIREQNKKKISLSSRKIQK